MIVVLRDICVLSVLFAALDVELDVVYRHAGRGRHSAAAAAAGRGRRR